jgi:hypothetical protein
MRNEPSPLAAWENAERAASQAEQQLFDQTLDAHDAHGLPSRADVERVRDLRTQACRLMLEAAAVRARIVKPRYLRSASWLAPGLAAALPFLFLPPIAPDACAAGSCAWGFAHEFGLFGIAASISAFLVAFATDHWFGRYAQDLARWDSGLPPR